MPGYSRAMVRPVMFGACLAAAAVAG